ncbi:MAG: cupin domain-containing protein [Acidobacteria bacterium]|nr:cupin domain-containing protein [Acidobacteriota bacterium]
MSTPIINLDNLEFREWGHGDRFQARLGSISAKIGAQKLGYNLTVLPPGKAAFPIHSHRVNEEMFFVVEGSGEIRIGSERHAIKKGDVIACPPGSAETAHQIVNTSQSDLKYLAVSTKLSPEIAEYPDSRKTGIYADYGTDASGQSSMLRLVLDEDNQPVDYWSGE